MLFPLLETKSVKGHVKRLSIPSSWNCVIHFVITNWWILVFLWTIRKVEKRWYLDQIDYGYLLFSVDGTALVKLVSREELIKQRERKLAIAAEKEAKKAAAAAERERKRLERLEKGKMAPQDMFKQSDEFSQFDEQGIPTHTKDGQEVAKSRRKKLVKEYEMQKKLHEEYLREASNKS